jgi:hypothetical protein
VKKGRNYPMYRRRHTSWLVVSVVGLIAPTIAHAHGAASADELGPPLLTSGLLGFASYWVVMLWPSSRKNQSPQSGSDRQNEVGSPLPKRKQRNAGRLKRTAPSGQVGAARVIRGPAGEEESGNG